METVCPVPAALTTVQTPTCPENIGQIQRIFFQRAKAAFIFDSLGGTSFLELASWTPLLVAAGDTKVVIAGSKQGPSMDTVIITPSTAITVGGGDNTTLNGRKLNTGVTAAELSGELRSMPSEIIEQLKLLQKGEELVVYFENQYKQLIGIDAYPGHPGQNIVGIPIFSLFFGDAGNEGFAKDDKAKFGFGMDYGWRANLYIKKPNFDTNLLKAVLET